MKKLGFPVIMLLVAAVIGVGVWSYFSSPFQVRIRRLAQASYEQSGVDKKRSQLALERMGAKAIPPLLKLLHHPNKHVRHAAAKALTSIEVQEFQVIKQLSMALADRSWHVRRQAAKAIGKRGWRASSAVGPLLMALKQEKEWLVRKELVHALGNIGPFAKAALPSLLRALDDQEWVVRRGSIRALRLIGLGATQAVPALSKKLQDPQWRVRAEAAKELGRLGARAARAFPLLERTTRDESAQVRLQASRALKRIGIRPILQALQQPPLWRQLAAARTLGALGEDANAALSKLQHITRNSPKPLQTALLKGFSQMGTQGTKVFLRFLEDRDPRLRALTASQLKPLGDLSVVAAPVLQRMLRDAQQEVRWSAAEAIAQLPPILPTLRALLSHKHTWLRRLTIRTLAQLGPQGVLILLEALSNSDAGVRAQAAQALGAFQTHVALIVRDLAVALKDKQEEVKIAAARALVKHGKKGQLVLFEHIQECAEGELLLLLDEVSLFEHLNEKQRDELLLRLRRALGSQVDANKVTAAGILGKLGPKAGLATFLLSKLLEDENDKVRRAAIRALGKVGPQAKIALAGLETRLFQAKGIERKEILRTVSELSQHTPHAILVLRKGLRSKNLRLRQLSALAVKQLKGKAMATLPDLLLSLEQPRMRTYAADAIRALGSKVVPSLLPLMRHNKQWIRWTAIEIVATFGAEAKAAIPALHKAIHDPVTPVRIAAARALGQIEPQDDDDDDEPPTPRAQPSSRPASRPTK